MCCPPDPADDEPMSPLVHAENVGDHVICIRWRHRDQSPGQRTPRPKPSALSLALLATVPLSFLPTSSPAGDKKRMQCDYAVVVAFLGRRRTPYGLVHDLRSIESLNTLAPIARQLLADATAIAKSGLVRRVAVLHSIRGAFATAAIHSLLKLSPAHPARAFLDADAGLSWANAHTLVAARSRACNAPHARARLTACLADTLSRPAAVQVQA